MRAFIAIELSNEIRGVLAQIESHLKYSGADVKWVEKDNIHLTLKFLGEITEEESEKIKYILDEIAKQTKPFELSLKISEEGSASFLGAFPNLDHPRVIWVGLDKGAAESRLVAEKVDDALLKIGFQKESRPFAAHLTIGRVRSPKNKEALKEKLSNLQLKIFPCFARKIPRTEVSETYSLQLIDAIALFQSKLTPKGPIYTKIHESKLIG